MRHHAPTVLLSLAVVAPLHAGGEMNVVTVSPTANTLAAPRCTNIEVTFDRAVDPASIDNSSFRVGGRWTGPRAGTITLTNGGQTVVFDPDGDFFAGDVVNVVLSRDLIGADAVPMRAAGYSFSFWTAAAAADMTFQQIDSMSLRDVPETSTRVYGGQAGDLDRDGWLDLACIMEDSSDIRVLMNKADGKGLFEDFMTPTNPTGGVPSPNESSDFNNDGFIDICTANTASDDVSVLFGNGDGTFQGRTDYAVGDTPHGIAVLDANGDGHRDIATANTSSSDVTLLLNDGNGIFGSESSFEGGGDGEYGLAAADMNNDGIMDLIVGARFSETVTVHIGNGDGTFLQDATQSAGGLVWMIVTGDVDGDGNVDLATANSSSNTGSIILGDGAGGLGIPTVIPTAAFVVATDLGDLDGDGDLDWITSSFSGGQWRLFENDGAGNFTFDQSFNAVSNCACAVILDTDNDHDLDLVLFDEIADLALVQRNTSTPPASADITGPGGEPDGVVDALDFLRLLAQWGSPCAAPCDADIDGPLGCTGDGNVDALDLLRMLAEWG